LFDMKLRAMRRDRAARTGVELFLYERAFADCLERLALLQRSFGRALLIGCPDPGWPERLRTFTRLAEVRDPGALFADRACGKLLVEDAWEPPEETYDLVVAVGTLDSVNDLPLALRLIRHAMKGDALLLGATSGGDTLPQLRNAMRAADAVAGVAAPHVHPRIEAAALAPLLETAGLRRPVVDVDRVAVTYPSLGRLVADLRAMGATNVLRARPSFVSRAAKAAAERAFTAAAGQDSRTIETFEILHFAAWTPAVP
jgi:hypothetical protein